MNDIVYVNGCSFTTGIDIADYLLKDPPQDISFNEYLNLTDSGLSGQLVGKYNNWRNNQYAEIVPGTLSLNYAGLANRHMVEIRYTNILEKLIGIPVVNKSAPGSDNNSIYLRTCNDIYNLRKQGYNVKKIIFQFTCKTRHSYIKELDDKFISLYDNDSRYLNYNKLDDEFICRSINYANIGHSSYTPAERYLLENDGYMALETEMKLKSNLLNHFSELKMYKDAIKGETGIEPIMVDSIFTAANLTRAKKSNPPEVLDFLTNPNPDTYIGRTILSLFPSGMDSMSNMVDKDAKSLTGGLHYNKEIHELFAKHLAEKYFNE